jgi:hypothetical protein
MDFAVVANICSKFLEDETFLLGTRNMREEINKNPRPSSRKKRCKKHSLANGSWSARARKHFPKSRGIIHAVAEHEARRGGDAENREMSAESVPPRPRWPVSGATKSSLTKSGPKYVDQMSVAGRRPRHGRSLRLGAGRKVSPASETNVVSARKPAILIRWTDGQRCDPARPVAARQRELDGRSKGVPKNPPGGGFAAR